MQLILTGSIALDRIMRYDGSFAKVIDPNKLEVLSLSLLLQDVQESRGGVAANIAYSVALFGDHPILYGSVGENGRSYMEQLATLGVDISQIHYSKLHTASFTVMTDAQNCQIGGFYPGAMADASSLSIQKLKTQDSLVVISPHDPTQMALQVRECTKLGIPYCYDIGQQVANCEEADIAAGVQGAHMLIVNEYEMQMLSQKIGRSAEQISAAVPILVVTLGEHGSDLTVSGKKQHIDALRVDTVVDPTGAGDAYRAGFLYGYTHGLEPAVCAQIASVSAAFCVESEGTQGHVFTKKSLFSRCSKMYGTLAQLKELL